MRKLTDNQKREICRLFYGGEKTKAELARSFNVSHTAISKILNDDKVSNGFKSLLAKINKTNKSFVLRVKKNKKSPLYGIWNCFARFFNHIFPFSASKREVNLLSFKYARSPSKCKRNSFATKH